MKPGDVLRHNIPTQWAHYISHDCMNLVMALESDVALVVGFRPLALEPDKLTVLQLLRTGEKFMINLGHTDAWVRINNRLTQGD